MLVQGDARHIPLPDQTVQCCITSPPYWGLRDYGLGDPGIGLERTPEEYVVNIVAVFREVWRVLRDEGTLWLNMGDSYAGAGGANNNSGITGNRGNVGGATDDRSGPRAYRSRWTISGLKPKDLCGVPWRIAFALQADGWYLRSDIIWHKPNPMPESVTDRPTKAHEYLFLMAKQARYYYDAEAIAESVVGNADPDAARNRWDRQQPEQAVPPGNNPMKRATRTAGKHAEMPKQSSGHRIVENVARAREEGTDHNNPFGTNRNRRDVWTIPTAPYKGAHFATFPKKLVEPCILAGTSAKGNCPQCGAPWARVMDRTNKVDPSAKGSRFDIGKTAMRDGGGKTQAGECYLNREVGWCPTCDHEAEPVPAIVLDCFCGSGTVGAVAQRFGRRFVGIDLSTPYLQLAQERIGAVSLGMAI
jgi:DNA modification methylase